MNNSESYVGKRDDEKSPETLEQEVNETRARIDDRLQTLSNRLSPGELVDQVLGMARDHGGDFTRTLCTQMKNNPVPTVLTGIGLAWLMMSSGSRNESSSGMRSPASGPGMMEKTKDAIHELGDQTDHLKQAASHTIERASDTAQRGMHHAKQSIQSVEGSLSNFLHEQPVLTAGLGVALGAALGALLPATEIEEKVLGKASKDTLEKARTVAASQYAEAKESVQELAENARQTLHGETGAQSNSGANLSASPANQAG